MNFAAARRNMVENQIRTNRITDPVVIAAMSEVPREAFLPDPLRSIAYIDEDIPLGNGRYLMEPLVVAQLLQAVEVQAEDLVLEIGCATGYASAVSARMAIAVVALESDPALAEQATAVLAELHQDAVAVVVGDLRAGYPRQAPFNVILFSGAVEEVSPAILDQLADGGRLAAVVRADGGLGHGTLFTRHGEAVSRRPVFDAATPLLPGFEKAPSFTF